MSDGKKIALEEYINDGYAAIRFARGEEAP